MYDVRYRPAVERSQFDGHATIGTQDTYDVRYRPMVERYHGPLRLRLRC